MEKLKCDFVHSVEMIQSHLDVHGTLTTSCALHLNHEISELPIHRFGEKRRSRFVERLIRWEAHSMIRWWYHSPIRQFAEDTICRFDDSPIDRWYYSPIHRFADSSIMTFAGSRIPRFTNFLIWPHESLTWFEALAIVGSYAFHSGEKDIISLELNKLPFPKLETLKNHQLAHHLNLSSPKTLWHWLKSLDDMFSTLCCISRCVIDQKLTNFPFRVGNYFKVRKRCTGTISCFLCPEKCVHARSISLAWWLLEFELGQISAKLKSVLVLWWLISICLRARRYLGAARQFQTN
jgi:hypothetical protein